MMLRSSFAPACAHLGAGRSWHGSMLMGSKFAFAWLGMVWMEASKLKMMTESAAKCCPLPSGVQMLAWLARMGAHT
jgi:hypothetical protein